MIMREENVIGLPSFSHPKTSEGPTESIYILPKRVSRVDVGMCQHSVMQRTGKARVYAG